MCGCWQLAVECNTARCFTRPIRIERSLAREGAADGARGGFILRTVVRYLFSIWKLPFWIFLRLIRSRRTGVRVRLRDDRPSLVERLRCSRICEGGRRDRYSRYCNNLRKSTHERYLTKNDYEQCDVLSSVPCIGIGALLCVPIRVGTREDRANREVRRATWLGQAHGDEVPPPLRLFFYAPGRLICDVAGDPSEAVHDCVAQQSSGFR
ncbi:hypothetical protein ACVWW1_006896 [Bradyrhizobium sp. JR3.5]